MDKKPKKIIPDNIPMKYREMILLLESIMYDIRAGWDKGMLKRAKDKRVEKCIDIICKINRAINNESGELCKLTKWDKMYEPIGLYLTGVYEGRILRTSYNNGGYEGLEKIHGLPRNPKHRSKWYQKELKKFQRYKLHYND